MGKYKVEITGIDTNKFKVLKNNECLRGNKKDCLIKIKG